MSPGIQKFLGKLEQVRAPPAQMVQSSLISERGFLPYQAKMNRRRDNEDEGERLVFIKGIVIYGEHVQVV